MLYSKDSLTRHSFSVIHPLWLPPHCSVCFLVQCEVGEWGRSRSRRSPRCAAGSRGWKPNYSRLREMDTFGSSAAAAESGSRPTGASAALCGTAARHCGKAAPVKKGSLTACAPALVVQPCMIPPISRPMTQLTCCPQEGEELRGCRGSLPAAMLRFWCVGGGPLKLSVRPGSCCKMTCLILSLLLCPERDSQAVFFPSSS